MRNHKLIGWVVGIPLLVILLILVIVFQEPDKEGISRAMAAKSVALALQSPDELKTWQKEYKTSFFPAFPIFSHKSPEQTAFLQTFVNPAD